MPPDMNIAASRRQRSMLAAPRCVQASSLETVVENLPLSYSTDQRVLVGESVSLPGEAAAEGASTSTFKRGHIRRSSYESAQIQLNFQRRTSAHALAARTNSLNRCSPSALSGPLIKMSLADTAAADCACSSASIETGRTGDSALGDSLSSKRSSLDRRSEVSVTDWTPSDVHFEEDEPHKSRKLQIPSISFPKGLFSRNKQPSAATTTSTAGWKLFGDRRHKDSNIVSSTGLILEQRPSGLPAKSDEEAAKHRALYLEAKKREVKEEKERKRAKEQERRLEEQAAAASKHWCEQILPKWEEMKNAKRCRELWWQGIPAKVRGQVWSLVIGNELNLTPELYKICIDRAREIIVHNKEENGNATPSCNGALQKETVLEQIALDVGRTFPSLGFFQPGGPFADTLVELLQAYVGYRPDVGYVQSMAFIAAVLLLQMEPFAAFVAFANLLNRPLQVAFFRIQQPQMTEYFIAYDRYLEQELPKIHEHFNAIDVRPDLIYTIYAKSLPFDVTCRVWDVFLRDGEEFLFKTALGVLRMYESQLLDMDFDDAVHFLTHLPESMNGAELFRNIEPFMRTYAGNGDTPRTRKRFLQILAEVNEKINPGSPLGSLEIRRNSELEKVSSNLQGMKMSKSLSGFIGDLLKPQSPQ